MSSISSRAESPARVTRSISRSAWRKDSGGWPARSVDLEGQLAQPVYQGPEGTASGARWAVRACRHPPALPRHGPWQGAGRARTHGGGLQVGVTKCNKVRNLSLAAPCAGIPGSAPACSAAMAWGSARYSARSGPGASAPARSSVCCRRQLQSADVQRLRHVRARLRRRTNTSTPVMSMRLIGWANRHR